MPALNCDAYCTPCVVSRVLGRKIGTFVYGDNQGVLFEAVFHGEVKLSQVCSILILGEMFLGVFCILFLIFVYLEIG